MRTSRIWSTVLALVVVNAAQAQNPAKLSPFSALAPEGEVISMKTLNLDKLSGSENCGVYFSFIPATQPSQPGQVGLVTFIYTSTGKDGGVVHSVPMIGSDKIEVLIVEGKKTPTAKMVRPGGPVYPWFSIEISAEDYGKSPCLKHSKLRS